MDFLGRILFGESNAHQQTSSDENKPPDTEFISTLEKQLIDNAVNSLLNLDPLSESLDVLNLLSNKVKTALDLQITELQQNCRKYEDICEEYREQIHQQTERLQDNSLSNDSVNKTDEKKREEELEETRKTNHSLISDYEEHKRKVDELKKKIRVKQLQKEGLETSFEIMKEIRSKEKEFLKSSESLNDDETVNADQQKDNSNLLKEIDDLKAQKNLAESKLNQSESIHRKLLEENIALKAKIDDQEKEKVEKEKQDQEAMKRFFKQIDQVVDAEIIRVETQFKGLVEQNQKTSEENKKLRLKNQELEKQVNSLIAKENEYQEKSQDLLTKVDLLVAEKDDLEAKCQRLENDHNIILEKYQNTIVMIDEQTKEKEISDKEYQEKLSTLLKSMDHFKEVEVSRAESKLKRLEKDNQKLMEENHDLRVKMLDIAIRDVMGIKQDNGTPQR